MRKRITILNSFMLVLSTEDKGTVLELFLQTENGCVKRGKSKPTSCRALKDWTYNLFLRKQMQL